MDSLLGGAKIGIKTAVDDIHDRNMLPPDCDNAEQAPLFPVAMMDDDDGAAAVPAKKGAGRPAGSKNRSTEEWRNYLFARYRSPLIGLAEIANSSVLELARTLRFETDTRKAKPEELLELAKVQIACRDKLAPYMHSKMPMAIEAGEHGLINLTIGAMGSVASQTQMQNPIDENFRVSFIENETAENSGLQSVKNENSVVSNSVVSNETAESQSVQDVKATDMLSVGNAAEIDGGA